MKSTAATRIRLHDKYFTPLLTADKIQEAVQRLGKQITADYQSTTKDENALVFVVVLKGSTIFASDLLRAVELPCHVEFLRAESYGHRITSSGTVQLTMTTALDVAGKDVILVEDIIDTGLTLRKLQRFLLELQPASLRIATLLLKPDICKDTIHADYVGFEISPLFVVGYGLDYNELGRNLPDIYVLSESE
jgi:hypoxanthine phosphoribosyltransferase